MTLNNVDQYFAAENLDVNLDVDVNVGSQKAACTLSFEAEFILIFNKRCIWFMK